MKLSINEAKLTVLNCAIIQQVLILTFAFGPEKFPGLSRNEPIFAMQRVTPSLFLSLSLSLSLSLISILFDFVNFSKTFMTTLLKLGFSPSSGDKQSQGDRSGGNMRAV